MKLIVGLGNPGERYERTRHNLGFMVLEQFLKNYEPVEKTVWEDNKKFKADLAEINWENERVILAKPTTHMNNSGMAVKLAISYWQLAIGDLWVLHDDIDLPLGKMKIRLGGGSAGHKGVDSIIKSLGTDKFVRFRLGISKPFKGKESASRRKVKGRRMLEKVDEYVLSSFLPGETHAYKELIKKGAKALEMALERGLEAAMNRFNAK